MQDLTRQANPVRSQYHYHLQKKELNQTGNYRGIALLFTAWKILARVLLNRLHPLSEVRQPESHCGFWTSRGTADIILVARHIQEKCQERNKDLYIDFIDLTKAFGSISREALWKVLCRFGCPANFITTLILLHDTTMTATVLVNWTETEPFTIRTAVKQGCVIAPTLFTIY